MAYAIIHAYILPALESDPDFEALCTVIKMDPDDVENADLLRVLMHEAAEGHPDFGWKFWTNFAFPLADMIGLSYAKIVGQKSQKTRKKENQPKKKERLKFSHHMCNVYARCVTP